MTASLRKLVWTLVALVLLTAPLTAQNLNNYLSGPHFNLNVIGVDEGKTSAMTNSNRHTIFVGLGRKRQPCDTSNGCSPVSISACVTAMGLTRSRLRWCGVQARGRDFPVALQTALTYDPTLGCRADVAQRSYTIWARALGKPGGSSSAMTCATDLSTTEVVCSTTNVLTLDRQKGKSPWQDATKQLTSLVADLDGDGDLETVALFADGF